MIGGEFRQVLCNITITPATHLQNQTRKKRLSFASRQCKTALQCTNTGRHGMTEIHSGSTTFLQPLFSTVGLLVVPKIGDVEKSTGFKACRSSGSRAQMNSQLTRIFLHVRNKEMDRTIEHMCSCNWGLC
ncbi:hypothetical protein TNCV_3343651 [Trichonephila clavipes]|nr:hypothetical protein TNCV_3343651 [Trichonephila clavipes]